MLSGGIWALVQLRKADGYLLVELKVLPSHLFICIALFYLSFLSISLIIFILNYMYILISYWPYSLCFLSSLCYHMKS